MIGTLRDVGEQRAGRAPQQAASVGVHAPVHREVLLRARPVTHAAVVGGLLLASLAGGPDLARWGPVAIGVPVAVPVVLYPALQRAVR
jgi:hypothetical protein